MGLMHMQGILACSDVLMIGLRLGASSAYLSASLISVEPSRLKRHMSFCYSLVGIFNVENVIEALAISERFDHEVQY